MHAHGVIGAKRRAGKSLSLGSSRRLTLQSFALCSQVAGRLIHFEDPIGIGQEQLPLVFEDVQLGVEAEFGAAFAKSGDKASAMRHFEAAIEANPHFPEPRSGKALLLKNQGHLDAAAEALESLLRDTSPGDARSNPVFQRAEQLLASIQKEIRERGGPTNPKLL